ncbi:MAG: tyrosine--tRNA ligase [Alphaproteobacteria bacterium]
MTTLQNILERGLIVNILPSKEEFIKQAENKKLNIYIGFDPTNVALHLGHAQNFMIMEELRQLGHKVFIVFGDFTACIGDPGDQKATRKQLTREQTTQNAKDWIKQVKNLMDFEAKENPPQIMFNSTWLDKLSIADFLELQSQTTVQRMLERDMFEKRIKDNKPVFLHEFSYPLFQAFDSVALNADVELCGTDQTFNALLGRQFVKTKLGKEKFCLIAQLMNHPITGEPMMSKSRNTGVFLNASANDMFGQIMAMPDVMIERLLLWNTRVSLDEIKELNIKNKPRDAKLFTAVEIVKIFHGQEQAKIAKENFIKTFSNRDFPNNAPVVKTDKENLTLFEILKLSLTEKSNSEIRRLILQNAVSINGKKCSEEKEEFNTKPQLQLKVGKLGFFKIIK